MDAEKIILNAEAKDGIITILEGTYMHPEKPLKIGISGTIDTVQEFLKKRLNCFKWLNAQCFINRENMSIKLIINETDKENIGVITGEIVPHPDFAKWKLNTGHAYNPIELSNFIKMNRSCFASKEIAMKLFAQLRDFKAKIDGICQQTSNAKGEQIEVIRSKAVEHNLPDSFTMEVPIFKGQKKQQFTVEINVNPDTLNCVLISPDAADLIQSFRDVVIDEQKKAIAELCPDLVIIEQ
jgi:hypothetical protein